MEEVDEVDEVDDVEEVVEVGGGPVPGVLAWKEVTVAVPAATRNRIPQEPLPRLLSVTLAIHPLGSASDAGQTLAVRVDASSRK